MKNIVLIVATIYGMTSVIMGAFGAHALKKVLSVDRLESLETAIRYQMYSALLLLILGLTLRLDTSIEKWSMWLLMVGTLFFVLTIYLLSFQDLWGVNLKFLGPITPLGGLLMIVGWMLLLVFFAKTKLK